METGYEHFGKFLLSHLKIVENPEELDWLFIIEEFKSRNRKRKIGLMHINWTVARYFKVDPLKVRYNKTRIRKLVYPKHISMYLASKLFNHTQYAIRDFYETKNRSSITNSIANVKNLMETDKCFKTDVEKLTNKLLGYEQFYEKPRSSTIRSSENIQEPEGQERNNMLINRNR